MEKGLVEHFGWFLNKLVFIGILCSFGIQSMYGKSRSSLFACIPKEVMTDLWLSNTPGTEKGVGSREEISSLIYY